MSRTRTNLTALEDDELLRELDEACGRSSVIKELCRRLEEALDRPTVRSGTCECPVCLATLEADYDEGNDVLELKTHD